jgi:esterase/lipase superfamily enzyme
MKRIALLFACLGAAVLSPAARAACPEGDDLDIQLRDKELQRHLILSGVLGAEIGRSNEKMRREAVIDFRAANNLPGTDQQILTEAECDMLKHNNDAVYAFIGFKQVVNPVNQLKMTFPAGLLPPEAKPSKLSWQEYENPAVSRVGIDVFRVGGRDAPAFALGYQSYSALTLTYVHNAGSEVIAEGAGNRWGTRYYFHNMNFEYQGGQRGIYIRFDIKPPENFVPPPEILAAARLERNKKLVTKLFTGGVEWAPAPTENEVAWALIARAVFNIVASDFYDQNGWQELTTRNCVFGSQRRARRGGVRIVFATTRVLANKDGDMASMFGSAANDKIIFGCVQVNPRWSSERGDNTYRSAWRGGARAANSRIKLLGDPIDRASENYVRIIDTSAAEDAKHALLILHGYNNTFYEALQSAARIAGGADYKGRVYMFSWPSVSSSWRYLQDVDNAEEAEGSLQAFLAAILRDNNITTLDIVAHSMGSQQLIRVMGSIRDILNSRRHEEGTLHLGQVVFAAPDVSTSVFNTKIATWAKLAERVTIYTSGGDWVLWLSSFLRGFNDRAGGHTPWGDPLLVNSGNVYVVDKTPPEYDFWKFFTYTHADYVDDKVILNDVQTVITGKPSGDPGKRDPEGKKFKAMPYRGASDRKFWATLPEGPLADAKEAVKEGLKPAAPAAPPTAQQPAAQPTATGTTGSGAGSR